MLTDAGTSVCSYMRIQTDYFLKRSVADVSILLALMVGRNVRHITSVVEKGDVSGAEGFNDYLLTF